MANITFSGVFSSIDTKVLVEAAMNARSRTLTRLTRRQDDQAARDAVFEQFAAALRQLQSAVGRLKNSNTINPVSVATSDATRASATVWGSGAVEGKYEILVDSLASGERMVHAGLTPRETYLHNRTVDDAGQVYVTADEISAAGGGRQFFTFRFGDTQDVVVDLSDFSETGVTLTELVERVNTAAGYEAARASLSGGKYSLAMQAEHLGADQQLTIDGSDAVGGLDGLSEFTRRVNGAAAGDALVGAGSFVYTYNGVTRTIVTDEWTSLSGLIGMINNDSANPGVAASVFEYDDPAGGRFHLVLSGRNTGADYTIRIEEATTLPGFADGGQGEWTKTQTASNARVRVDGYPASGWIESASNVLATAIPGVSLNLLSADADKPFTLTVNRDASQIVSSLQEVVEHYNFTVDLVDRYSGYDRETGTSGLLQGDSMLTSMLSRVRSTLVGPVPGFEAGLDSLRMASEIGLDIDRWGKLSLDTARLNDALNSDYSATLGLLGATRVGRLDSDDLRFDMATSATASGSYQVQVTYDLDGAVASAMIREAGGTWRAAEVAGSVISGAAGTMEQGLRLTALASRPGETATYELRVQQGFAGRAWDAIEEMVKPLGSIDVRRSHYASTTDTLKRQIQAEQDRLDVVRSNLEKKYARMERALAELDSFRGAVDSMLASLESNRNAAKKG